MWSVSKFRPFVDGFKGSRLGVPFFEGRGCILTGNQKETTHTIGRCPILLETHISPKGGPLKWFVSCWRLPKSSKVWGSMLRISMVGFRLETPRNTKLGIHFDKLQGWFPAGNPSTT